MKIKKLQEYNAEERQLLTYGQSYFNHEGKSYKVEVISSNRKLNAEANADMFATAAVYDYTPIKVEEGEEPKLVTWQTALMVYHQFYQQELTGDQINEALNNIKTKPDQWLKTS